MIHEPVILIAVLPSEDFCNISVINPIQILLCILLDTVSCGADAQE